MEAANTKTHKQQNNQLCIDHVLSSQPELGSTIPDGGYGWIILLASSFFQIVIPSLPVGFGIIILFTRLENSTSSNLTLWDIKPVYVPLFFIGVWTLTEPCCKKIVSVSTWPRLVSVAATCLTSAGLLIMWIAFNCRNTTILYIAAGSISGFGASLITTQVDVIICQYFYLKLKAVKALLATCTALGFIITPIFLGHHILRIGILQSISWYQAIILQGIIVSITFKKPKYLKEHQSRYNLLQGISDEEEDIFTKNVTELQSPRPSTQNTTSVSANDTDYKNNVKPLCLEDELDQAGVESKNKHSKLNVAFAVEIDNTTKTACFEDNFEDLPQPLFTDLYINNNVSYSYESSHIEIDNPVVFMPIPTSTNDNKWTTYLHLLKTPTFYKALLITLTLKYSIFFFWTLFPSYLYIKVDHLKVHHAAVVVGCIGLPALVFSTVAIWIKISIHVRNIIVSILCWTSSAGCLILSALTMEPFIILAAVIIILNINSLHILAVPPMKFNGQMFLTTVVTVLLIALLGIELSYQNCFQLMAILQFLTGSVCFTNVIYKGIKKYKLSLNVVKSRISM